LIENLTEKVEVDDIPGDQSAFRGLALHNVKVPERRTKASFVHQPRFRTL
jgi:hypothetical protein